MRHRSEAFRDEPEAIKLAPQEAGVLSYAFLGWSTAHDPGDGPPDSLRWWVARTGTQLGDAALASKSMVLELPSIVERELSAEVLDWYASNAPDDIPVSIAALAAIKQRITGHYES